MISKTAPISKAKPVMGKKTFYAFGYRPRSIIYNKSSATSSSNSLVCNAHEQVAIKSRIPVAKKKCSPSVKPELDEPVTRSSIAKYLFGSSNDKSD